MIKRLPSGKRMARHLLWSTADSAESPARLELRGQGTTVSALAARTRRRRQPPRSQAANRAWLGDSVDVVLSKVLATRHDGVHPEAGGHKNHAEDDPEDHPKDHPMGPHCDAASCPPSATATGRCGPRCRRGTARRGYRHQPSPCSEWGGVTRQAALLRSVAGRDGSVLPCPAIAEREGQRASGQVTAAAVLATQGCCEPPVIPDDRPGSTLAGRPGRLGTIGCLAQTPLTNRGHSRETSRSPRCKPCSSGDC